jgi:hypothetical protein
LLQKASRGLIVSQLLYLAFVVVSPPPPPQLEKEEYDFFSQQRCKPSPSSSLCELEDGKLYGMMQEKMALRSLQV